MRSIALIAGICIGLLALSGCTFDSDKGPSAAEQLGELSPGNASERQAATDASARFLRLIDAGRIEQTWPILDDHLQSQGPKTAWLASANLMRVPLGTLVRRSPIGAGFTAVLKDDSPSGTYYVVFFDSRYEKARAEEKVVIGLHDGQWRVAGYHVSIR